VNVRAATLEDVEIVGSLLDEATAWVNELGHEQWPRPFPRKEIAAAIARGEVFVGEIASRPVATVTVLAADPLFWGQRPPDALYIHKLAVARDHSGQGLGAELVDWVNARAAEAGRTHLRLDCLRDDPGIRAYYEQLGFEYCGDLDDTGRGLQISLYERKVPDTTP
jgi:GNAT superfamily N-acetyltransferase